MNRFCLIFLETVLKGENSDREAGEEDSWDTMFDDDGECVDPSAMDEVCPPYIMLVNLRNTEIIQCVKYMLC